MIVSFRVAFLDGLRRTEATDERQREGNGVRKRAFALWMLHILCFLRSPDERTCDEMAVALHKYEKGKPCNLMSVGRQVMLTHLRAVQTSYYR